MNLWMTLWLWWFALFIKREKAFFGEKTTPPKAKQPIPKQTRGKVKANEGPKCYKCGEEGHISSGCPLRKFFQENAKALRFFALKSEKFSYTRPPLRKFVTQLSMMVKAMRKNTNLRI